MSLFSKIIGRERSIETPLSFRNELLSSQCLVQKLARRVLLEGHQGCVNSVLFSEDGYYALTGSDDTYVNIYDCETGKLKYNMNTQHTNNIFYVKDLPATQGNKIVTCAADGR